MKYNKNMLYIVTMFPQDVCSDLITILKGCVVMIKAVPNFIELLAQKILLNNCLLLAEMGRIPVTNCTCHVVVSLMTLFFLVSIKFCCAQLLRVQESVRVNIRHCVFTVKR